MATTTNTLRLKVGGKYKTRDGQAAEIVQHDPISTPWTFWGYVGTARLSWKPNGRYFSDRFHGFDLVEEIVESPTLILEPGKRYLTRDGRVAEVTGPNDYDREFVFEGMVDGKREVWRPDGSWHYLPNEEYGLDLVSEIPTETPEYRYFRWAADDRTDKHFIIWRNAPGDRLVEGWLPNLPGDEWQDTELSLTDDLLSDPDIIECDSEGLIHGRPEPVAAGALAPATRTRIAKLAARIVLADGPVLTVDELAGMTIGELVAKLEPSFETEYGIYL